MISSPVLPWSPSVPLFLEEFHPFHPNRIIWVRAPYVNFLLPAFAGIHWNISSGVLLPARGVEGDAS